MWYIIPDTHGRDSWKTAINNFDPNIDKVIFLGDYLDPYPGEATNEEAIDNFKEIIKLKKEYPDNIILLLGNHDLPYYSEQYNNCLDYKCRYDYTNHKQIEELFKEVDFQFTVKYGNVLFSHAGVTNNWLLKHKINLDNIEEFCSNNIKTLSEVSELRGGSNYWGSLVWADLREFLYKSSKVDNVFQIFGHTYSESVYVSNLFAMLDTGGKTYGILNNNTLSIKDVTTDITVFSYLIMV